MTPADVMIRVGKIAAMADDDEAAHHEEDVLWSEVLYFIAAGAPDAAELARCALRTSDIKFGRWCA